MSDTSADLSALWQQQPTNHIDMQDLTRRLKRQQRAQRLYLVLDMLGFVPAIWVLIATWDELSSLLAGCLITLVAVTFVFYLYIAWLRRHAALATFGDTSHYVDTLKKQLLNNHKIARLTFHSCWMSGVALVAILGMMAMFEDYTLDNLRRSVWVLVLIVSGLVGTGVWAHKRAKRFHREYLHLADLGNKGNTAG